MENYWKYRYDRDKKIDRLFCEKKGVDEKELSKLRKGRWDEFDEFVGGLKFTPVLDFGCGLGFMSMYFGSQHYIGVDVIPELIQENRKRYQNHIFVHAPERMYIHHSYDLIFCRGVLQHFTNKMLKFYLEQFEKHCKNLIVFSPRGSLKEDLRPESTEAAACLRQKPDMIRKAILRQGFMIHKESDDHCKIWAVPKC